jgi:glycine/D-amino acid oxidase-like deaminating enzyme
VSHTMHPLRPATSTLWMEQADRTDSPVTLRSQADVDVCVVGGGFTGLWTALSIKRRQPELAVCVVEAAECGAGASGANGGFAMTWWPKFGTLKKLFGVADAVALAQCAQQAVASIGHHAAEHAIDADFKAAGWLWAATNAAQLGSWQDTLEQAAAAGQSPYTELSADQVHELTGSDRHLGGVFEAGVATLHPGRLVEGLRRQALGAGVRVYEASPMVRLEKRGTGTDVVTPAGRARAKAVVLATNAALASILEVRRHVVVLDSDVVTTAPCPDRLAETGFPQGLAVSDSRRLVHYYRTTDDDRMVFGKGGGGLAFHGRTSAGVTGASSRHCAVESHLRRVLPKLNDVPITHRWSGSVDYSVDGLPFAGRLRSNPAVCYMSGFSGNGVGPSYLAGEVLASLALGSDDEWSRSPLVRTPRATLPPEPFRYVGGNVVRRALERQERLEDRGASVDVVTSLITRLDPTSFVG